MFIHNERESLSSIGIKEKDLVRLLSRSPLPIVLDSVVDQIRGKTILISGAGGSIGAELARQVMTLAPRKLLLVDHCEYHLYLVAQELKTTGAIEACLVDIKDRVMVDHVVISEKPEVVFHAAAYKHVPLVEENPYAGILNNIMGTQNLLMSCQAAQTPIFVGVSTDKAVCPTGVMGKTKRVCEFLIARMGLETGRQYYCVRFGNVLGSSGSLIPLLAEQIASGGPITVTHPRMERYFMLTSEAVMLVLRSMVVAAGGDIAILEMGKPLRVMEVVTRMMAIMGKKTGEIPVVYTGLRPGEKMVEELSVLGEIHATQEPHISVLPHGDLQMERMIRYRTELPQQVAELIRYASQADGQSLEILDALIAEDLAERKVLVKKQPARKKAA